MRLRDRLVLLVATLTPIGEIVVVIVVLSVLC